MKIKSPNTYFTSDLHFFHENILTWHMAYRQWPDVLTMNSSLLDEINKLPSGAVLFHLGDLVMGGKKKVQDILDRLRTDITFIAILGNHDAKPDLMRDHPAVDSVHHYLEISYQGKKICLFHYPMHVWNCSQYGSLHFHGHMHGSFDGPGKAIDVGWDAHGKILSIDEAVVIADKKEKYTV